MSGASHHIEPEVYNGVSTLDEPSAKWGWHDLGLVPTQIAGWVSVFFLLGYNFGNHKGHVETIWLFLLAGLVAIGLLLQLFAPKLNQVRTVTAHNKPEGHQEPVWTYQQHAMTGKYAELSDSELRALNIDPSTVPNRTAVEK
ncbi:MULTISPECIES: DUF2631 domain-containing protein [unclassified Corynebacterium]|uniref:DUF2631 domain-containing protein n=1 Tax=unclassified Corynebacterium TaxID=2624378 RepID=UPI001C43E1AF|nr:DUF2631 domain-containing protein [Corynebacterium sp. TAE3-ERU30]MBV7301711.1 DUF2631 domain-containing protein [Corynebacterium sp. TAE3-ERU2]